MSSLAALADAAGAVVWLPQTCSWRSARPGCGSICGHKSVHRPTALAHDVSHAFVDTEFRGVRTTVTLYLRDEADTPRWRTQQRVEPANPPPAAARRWYGDLRRGTLLRDLLHRAPAEDELTELRLSLTTPLFPFLWSHSHRSEELASSDSLTSGQVEDLDPQRGRTAR